MTLPPSTPADDATFVCASSPTHSPARPLDDRARLNALHRLDLCAVDADGTFTRFVRLTQRLLAPRVSLVALIEQDSQFIKASAEREREHRAEIPTALALELNQVVTTTGTPLRLCTSAEVAAISPRCAAALPLRAYLGHPIRTPDGFTIGVIAALESESRTWNREDAENLRDIAALLESEIARTHEHLLAVARERAVADRFKKILGHANCLIWDAVVTCRTSGWEWQFTVQPSRLVQRLFGAKPAHPSNGPWDQFDLAERAQINERSRQAMLTGQPSYSHEFEVNVSGESAIWIHEDVAVRSIGANRFWLVGAATEVTHRKHREMEVARERDDAREASRLKSQFLANMSHEIRTPMNGIVGMAGLLLESPLNDDQRRISQVIQESGESLLAIINDVLDLAKIEADKTSLEYRPLDLRKVVLSVLTLLHPQADRKGITLVCEISQRLPDALLGDANRIRQVVTNLVGNAVNYTRSGTVKLKLEVLSLGERACEFRLTVADTGPGIPPQIQKKLFQPFVQADEADVLRSGGTGLGLAISKQLIEKMGGRIEMDSEPGAGSAFWIELLLNLAEANAVETPEASPPPDFTPTAHHAATPIASLPAPAPSDAVAHVLVVEDNPTNQVVVTLILTRMNITFQVANNGQEAWDVLGTAPFDAILMDCQMPVVDGYTATQQIRAGAIPRTNPHIPIIALTAYAMRGDRERCLAVGMNEHVTKPLRMEDLRAALQRCGINTQNHGSRAAPAIHDTHLMDPELVAEYREMPGEHHATVLGDLIENYLTTADRSLASLRQRIEIGDTEQAGQLAHALAGTCANLGARSVRSALIAVEKAARNALKSEALERLDACHVLLAQLNREARRHLENAA